MSKKIALLMIIGAIGVGVFFIKPFASDNSSIAKKDTPEIWFSEGTLISAQPEQNAAVVNEVPESPSESTQTKDITSDVNTKVVIETQSGESEVSSDSVGFTLTVKSNPQAIFLTKDDDGKIISVNKDDKIVVTLMNPGDGGYQFLDPIFDSSSLKLSQHEHLDQSNSSQQTVVPIVGNFGFDVWLFQVKEPGKSQIVIPIKRSWETESIIDFTINLVSPTVN